MCNVFLVVGIALGHRSLDCICCMYVCMSARRFIQFVSGSCYDVAAQHIINIMKVCIERNNMQVELIRVSKKYVDLIHVANFEVGIYFRHRCIYAWKVV